MVKLLKNNIWDRTQNETHYLRNEREKIALSLSPILSLHKENHVLFNYVPKNVLRFWNLFDGDPQQKFQLRLDRLDNNSNCLSSNHGENSLSFSAHTKGIFNITLVGFSTEKLGAKMNPLMWFVYPLNSMLTFICIKKNTIVKEWNNL